MRIVAGVDCHKASHTVVFLTSVGVPVECMVIPTTEAEFEAALAAGDRLGCQEWGLEGAGCYGFGLAVYAAARGLTVLEVPGLLTKRHRRQSSRRGKSDETDAVAIAEVVLREGPRLSRFQPCATQRAMRLRYDQRDRHVRARTAAANRLRMAAVLLGVMTLPRSLTSARAIRTLLETARAFRAEVTGHPAALALVDDMIDAAEDVERLNAKIRATERDLQALVRGVADELVALRGVSIVTAAGLIGHAGAMTNYRNGAAFAAKCGAAPVPCSSGRRVAVRLSTGGDRQLNRLLHVIAMAQVLAADHPGRAYYDRKRAEGKAHPAAMRCLKRQLATVVYYRLRQVQQRLDAEGATDATAA